MENLVLKGKIIFDPENRTRKHNRQSDWKRIAMVHFDGEMCDYYAWFIERRYNLKLNKPLRGSHITFINDSTKDLTKNFTIPIEVINDNWSKLRDKWDGKEIEVTLNLDLRSNGEHWWMKVHSQSFEDIRTEIELGRPFFNYHMTIGYANERNIEHSEYIVGLIDKFGNNYGI